MRPQHELTIEAYLQFSRGFLAEHYLPVAGDTSEIEEFRQVQHKFLVLCSSRTGSELLCYLLRDFGAAVGETLNLLPDIAGAVRERGHDTLRSLLVERCRQTPRSTFGVKGTGMMVAPFLIYDELPAHRDEWKFVVLHRRDVLQQAVSLAIAERTGSWRSNVAATAALRAEDYDPAHILRCMDAIARVDAHIARIESALGVETLHVDFEDLIADRRGTADHVGAFLGLTRQGTTALDGRDGSVAPPRSQGSDINRLWAERFRREQFDIAPRRARALS